MSPTVKDTIGRLNILLAVPTEKKPNWTRLREKLVYAIWDRKTVTAAHKAMLTDNAMYEALETIRLSVSDLRAIGYVTLSLEAHNMMLIAQPGAPVISRYGIIDCRTAVFVAFRYLIERAQITGEDFLVCRNSKCGKTFVPLRKPAKGKAAYCCIQHGRQAAVWGYRIRQAAMLKAKERERSNRRYEAKCKAKRRQG